MVAVAFPVAGGGCSRLSLPAATPSRKASPGTYRRRQGVAAVLVLGAVLSMRAALGVLGGGPLTASEQSSTAAANAPAPVAIAAQPVSRTAYVVQPGDTLWSIARSLQPDGDVRALVDALAELNPGPLQVGDRIVVP